MKKRQMRVQVDEGVENLLHEKAARFGLTGNAVLAVAAYELSRVPAEHIFHALGRIAAGEGVEILPPESGALPEAKRQPRRAIPAGS